MLLSVVCLVMLGSVWAADPPPKCCFEKEYTATLGEVGARVVEGIITPLTGVIDIAYDFYRKRMGTRSIVTINGASTTMYTLRDYANRYVYEKPSVGTCTYHRMGDHFQMYPPCVPDNATYLGPVTFGYGSETLVAQSWEAVYQHPNMTFKIAVTDDCVPVFDAFYGTRHGNPSEMTFFYTAYNPGIENMESLNIPDPCFLIDDPHHHHNGTAHTGNRPIGRRNVRPM